MSAGGRDSAGPDWYEAVYDAVRRIPPGKVATYGQIADSISSVSVGARQVGTAMRYAPEGVAWQRVIGAGGRLPIAKRSPELKLQQRQLLRNEGVVFLTLDSDRVDMTRSQWRTAILQDAESSSVCMCVEAEDALDR